MEGKKTTKNILDIFSHVCMFIFIQYMLACFYLSFTAHILNIVFLTCNAGVIINFWVELSRIIKNKILRYSIICLSIVAVGLILLLWGYFPVSTALREVLLWRRLRDFLLLPYRRLCLWWLCHKQHFPVKYLRLVNMKWLSYTKRNFVRWVLATHKLMSLQ